MARTQEQAEGTTPVTNPNALSLDELTTALQEAQTRQQAAVAAFAEAGATSDMKAMLAASTELQAAARAVEKANTAIQAATYEQRAGERMEASSAFKSALDAVSMDYAKLAELGIRGATIAIDNEGNVTVNITTNEPKAPRATRSSNGTTERKPRGLWAYNGDTYTSSELLLQHGGEDGAKAVDRARNYKDYGMKFSPGFDAAVKKLAADIGATRIEA